MTINCFCVHLHASSKILSENSDEANLAILKICWTNCRFLFKFGNVVNFDFDSLCRWLWWKSNINAFIVLNYCILFCLVGYNNNLSKINVFGLSFFYIYILLFKLSCASKFWKVFLNLILAFQTYKNTHLEIISRSKSKCIVRVECSTLQFYLTFRNSVKGVLKEI